jgi:hypothetical protein
MDNSDKVLIEYKEPASGTWEKMHIALNDHKSYEYVAIADALRRHGISHYVVKAPERYGRRPMVVGTPNGGVRHM